MDIGLSPPLMKYLNIILAIFASFSYGAIFSIGSYKARLNKTAAKTGDIELMAKHNGFTAYFKESVTHATTDAEGRFRDAQVKMHGIVDLNTPPGGAKVAVLSNQFA